MVNPKLLHEIKLLGEDYRNGDELIRMLDYYGAHGLREINDDQARDYYDKRVIEVMLKKGKGK